MHFDSICAGDAQTTVALPRPCAADVYANTTLLMDETFRRPRAMSFSTAFESPVKSLVPGSKEMRLRATTARLDTEVDRQLSGCHRVRAFLRRPARRGYLDDPL